MAQRMLRAKPLLHPQKPKRLPERKRMTIALGFCTSDGGLLCADTYDAITGLSKGFVRKVRLHSFDGCAIGFAGAGTGGICDGLERAIAEALERSDAGTSDVRVRQIEGAVRRFYRRYIWPDPQFREGSGLEALILFHDLTTRDSMLLKSSHSPVLSKHMDYASIGSGSFVANRWRELMIPYGFVSPLDWAAAIALYLVCQAKQSVDGCGDWTDFVMFRREGAYGPGHAVPIRELEHFFSTII